MGKPPSDKSPRQPIARALDNATILRELALTGSVEALLRAHPEVQRDHVRQALNQAASLVDTHDDTRRPNLVVLYDGYIVGVFTGAFCFFQATNDRTQAETTAQRISAFMVPVAHEYGVKLNLDGDNLEEVIEHLLGRMDEKLLAYYRLGLSAFLYALLSAHEDRHGDVEKGERVLQALGHPPMLFKATLDQEVRREAGLQLSLESAMSRAMRLARDLVLGLPPEPHTCFVAMPFEEPYETRYLNLYRQLARNMSKRAFRAWGGIQQEQHQELLLAILSKTGALIADVTIPNANVTLELGFALGHRVPVYLLAESERWQPIANIPREWVFPYTPATSGQEWEIDAAGKAGLYFTMLEPLKRPGAPFPIWTIQPADMLEMLSDLMRTSDTDGA